MIKKIFFATCRDVGVKCKSWAEERVPEGFEITDSIEESNIVISIIYDKILKDNFLKNRRCFNFHCGKLPEYGGSNIPVWSILNDEKEFGITLHRIDKGLDTGDVIDIQYFDIKNSDTAYSIFKNAELVIYEMFCEWFEKIILGDYTATPQDKSKVKIYYKKKLEKIKDITKLVKALHFPGKEPLFFFNSKGKKVYIRYD